MPTCLSRLLLAITLLALPFPTGCSSSNNLLLGRVCTRVGSHEVVVTDCYRIHVPGPVATSDGFEYSPCRDAHVVVSQERLTVNGKDYGQLSAGDSILVDHGLVSVGRATAAVR